MEKKVFDIIQHKGIFMKDNILALDLELNQPSKSIIQIGIAVGNFKSGAILHNAQYNIYTPENLDPRIIELTGIKQNDVDNGINISAAYKEVVKVCLNYDCFINMLTWGGGDSDLLKTQVFNFQIANGEIPDPWAFGRRWIDAKTLYISYRASMGKETQGGLAKAMTKFGMAFKGRKHNAQDDAINTFLIYRRMLQEFKNSII